MVMDNEEVTIIKWKTNNLKQPKGKEAPAEEFLQKKAYYVLPQMKELQREKQALKRSLAVKDGD